MKKKTGLDLYNNNKESIGNVRTSNQKTACETAALDHCSRVLLCPRSRRRLTYQLGRDDREHGEPARQHTC